MAQRQVLENTQGWLISCKNRELSLVKEYKESRASLFVPKRASLELD